MRMLKLFAAAALAVFFVGAQAQTSGGELRSDFEKLITDVRSALADSTVTPDEIQALKTSLATALDGATKPSPVYVEQLRLVVNLAKQDGVITDAEKQKIQKALANVFASANIPPNEVAAVKSALQAIWMSANISQEELATIIADIQAIIADLPEHP